MFKMQPNDKDKFRMLLFFGRLKGGKAEMTNNDLELMIPAININKIIKSDSMEFLGNLYRIAQDEFNLTDTVNDVTSSMKEYINNCYTNPSFQKQHLSGSDTIFNFEDKLRNYYNKKFALLFSNATTALHAVALAFELTNSEIITSPFNWGGSLTPFLLHRNKLRFTSVDVGSLNLSIDDLTSVLTSKSKAVLSVDYCGTPVDSEAIKYFCLKHDLKYIADCAQSLGASKNGKPAGYYADAIVLSFSSGKSIFGGEGGALVTDDEQLYEKLLWFSQHPSRQKSVFGLSNYNEYAPLNGRVNPLSAILLNSTFEFSMMQLMNSQFRYFEVIHQLQLKNLVEKATYISSPDSSTYFNFSLKLTPKTNLKMINKLLCKIDIHFSAVHSSLKMIPFDPSFKKQYKGKFSCSEKLKKQNSNLIFNDRITLIDSPSTY